MVDKKEDFELMAYIFGIISLGFILVNQIGGIIFGIIGLSFSKKQKTRLSEKARKYSTIGIVVNTILLIISIIVTGYLFSKGLATLPDFP